MLLGAIKIEKYCLGFLALVGLLTLPQVDEISLRQNGAVNISGKVENDPRVSGIRASVTLTHTKINKTDVFGRVILGGIEQTVTVGDMVTARCILQKPLERSSLQQRLRPLAICAFPKDIRVSAPRQGSLRRVFAGWRTFLGAHLATSYGAPDDALLAGLLFGERANFPQWLTNALRRTGTSHIVAVSGFNVTLIIVGLMGLARAALIRKKISVPLIIIFLCAFTIFTGGSASVVRAAVMGGLTVIAGWIVLHAAAPRLLLISAAVMTAFDPSILLADASFALSFLATAGLIWLSPSIQKFLERVPVIRRTASLLSETLGAMFATLPYSIFAFGQLSFIAPLANLLVVPLVAPTMLLGALALALKIIPVVGTLMVWATGIFLALMIFILRTLAAIPWASMMLR
ncbi:MAG: competence protein ComEC [Candidatus Magasanikbacteria bacterium]|nr:competence protein ComEC [Candidatus Magasanikbacteria bacterium]